MALLTVEDLELHYATERGTVRAVDGVSFEIAAGAEALGVIGETGSGKSSLMLGLTRMLPRNVERYAGMVRFDGEELTELAPDRFRHEVRWKKLAVVFQGAMNGFNPVLRMGAQLTERMLMEPEFNRRSASEKMGGLLEKVGLRRTTLSRFPHELSGGMKQRAAIAMALALDPPLLVLDEPTSALDVSVQAQIMNLLKRLKWDLGLSMLFITHDIALASDISDRIAVMYAGQIREYGSADVVLGRPFDPYTQELLGSIPRMRGTARPRYVAGFSPDPTAVVPGCRFHPRCPRAFERCRQEAPQLFETEPGHFARCWLYEPGRRQ